MQKEEREPRIKIINLVTYVTIVMGVVVGGCFGIFWPAGAHSFMLMMSALVGFASLINALIAQKATFESVIQGVLGLIVLFVSIGVVWPK